MFQVAVVNRTTLKRVEILLPGHDKNSVDAVAQIIHPTIVIASTFTAKYHVTKLIYFEVYSDIKEAIKREANQSGFAEEEI